MYRILLLSIAGVFGTLLRYWISGWVAKRYGETFPTGTLVVNLLGCFAIGFLFYLLHERLLVDPVIRTAILIGFFGAFTTFSSYGLQMFTLLRDGEAFLASVYFVTSNVLGVMLAWVGYIVSKNVAVRLW